MTIAKPKKKTPKSLKHSHLILMSVHHDSSSLYSQSS